MKNQNKDIYYRIFGYIKKYKFSLFFAFICAVLNVCFTLLVPVFVGSAIDEIIAVGNVNFDKIIVCLLWIALFIAAGSICAWGMGALTRKVSAYSARDFRNDAFSHLGKAPLSYIDRTPQGDFISAMVNDADLVSDGILQGLTQLLPGVTTIVLTLVIMLVLNPIIACVVFVLTPLSIFMATYITKKSRKFFLEQAQDNGELSGYIKEMVSSQNIVKAFSREEICQEEFSKITDKLFVSGVKSLFYSSVANPATRFVNGIVYAAVGVIGAWFAIKGTITVGQLSCFLTYSNQYTKPFNEVTGVLSQVQTAVAGASRLFKIIDSPEEIAQEENAISKEKSNGEISLTDVYFQYVKDRPLIRDFNLDVKSGQKIAIVGPTGCGKTTLINLLMRFYDIDSGTIKVDGINIKDIKRSDLRALYGMVLQDTWLQQATVSQNIAYGRPNATKEEIEAAARASYAHSFIKRLPQGYDTVIMAGGGNISAGQKQLLCIARIMLTQPDILILDEATSSIDTRTEMLIQKAFDKLMHGRTSFVVAHRLSTIKSADVILVMKDGNVIEKGSHDELLAKGDFYANLYNSQFVPL